MPLTPCPACQQEIPEGTLFCPRCGRVDPEAAEAEARSASNSARKGRDSGVEWIAALLVIGVITLWGVRVGKAAENDTVPVRVAADSSAERTTARRGGGSWGGSSGKSSSGGRRSAEATSQRSPGLFCPYIPQDAVASPANQDLFRRCRSNRGNNR